MDRSSREGNTARNTGNWTSQTGLDAPHSNSLPYVAGGEDAVHVSEQSAEPTRSQGELTYTLASIAAVEFLYTCFRSQIH